MINPEMERRFQEVFDAHDAAIAALRGANAAIGRANTGQIDVNTALIDVNRAMIETQLAFGVAIQLHDDATALALSANRAALAILRAYQDGNTP